MLTKAFKVFPVLMLMCLVVGGESLAAPYRAEKVTILRGKEIGSVKGKYFVPSTPETVSWGRLPNRNTKPVLTMPSGASVTFDTVSHEGILEDQGKDPVKYYGRYGVAAADVLPDAITISTSALPHDFDKDGPHIVTGPVHVEGAKPGDVLKVEVLHLEPRVPYGVISNRHYKGALVGEFPEGTQRKPEASPAQPELYGNVSIFTPISKMEGKWYGTLKEAGKDIQFPLSPFVGIMGVTPDTDESWNSVPPARIGGNIDINELGVGATLYLPVEVEGAGFYMGDPHFVQGDGEVALTALEGSLRATVRLTVLKKGTAAVPKSNSDNLTTPFAETEKFWIPIGLNEDLDEAMKMAVRESISFLARQFGLDRRVVYAYLSAAADYEVSQVVDKTKGVHALIPKVDFKNFLSIEIRAGKAGLPVKAVNGELYVSASEVCAALGLKYNAAKGVISVAAPAGAIGMTVDSNKYVVDGRDIYINVSPLQTGEGVLLPVAVLGDVLGLSVNWSTEGTKIIGVAQLL
ncbi:MAG: acetamidase/formamidase family protein [Desulfovibrio sp.]|jgi:acetamidase/formamidase|nr:acetamidase/formamidase family protein [Desulfovibrio sp.]